MQQFYRRTPMGKHPLRHGCYPVKLLHFFITLFYKNIYWGVLLNIRVSNYTATFWDTLCPLQSIARRDKRWCFNPTLLKHFIASFHEKQCLKLFNMVATQDDMKLFCPRKVWIAVYIYIHLVIYTWLFLG